MMHQFCEDTHPIYFFKHDYEQNEKKKKMENNYIPGLYIKSDWESQLVSPAIELALANIEQNLLLHCQQCYGRPN